MEESDTTVEPSAEGLNLPDESPVPKKLVARKAIIWTSFGTFLVFLLAVSIFFYTNFKTIEVQGNSMEPTLTEGQRLLISDAYWLVGELKVDDVVVINNPFEDEIIIKRVSALAGETIDYAQVPANWDITRGRYVVPQGSIFVLGDNYEVSQDSRHYGAFPLKSVIGKVVVVQSAIGAPEESGS